MPNKRNELMHKSPPGSHGLRTFAQLVGMGLLVASIVRELRMPKEERTWHGLVFGRVPYDLRPPTFGRLKAAMWNPRDPHVVMPTAFGVGWTINLAALRKSLATS